MSIRYHKYRNYEEYVEAQTEANVRKNHKKWVQEPTIKLIHSIYSGTPNFILCHGTRNGEEQRLFKKYYPEAVVLGTEISETALNFEMTIHHDFMKPIPDYIGHCDIVYSNSLDHCTDVHQTLQTWKEQVKEGGTLFIEFGRHIFHETTSCASDPLTLTEKDLLGVFEETGLSVNSTNIVDAMNVKKAATLYECSVK